MPFAVGQNIGPYRIIEQLGQGGMATVYKAYHAALDRYVALKVLHPAFREDSTFLGRFTREARVVAKLEHPHIVPIYDYAEFEGQPYLVMKYIEGETLKARLNRSPLSVEEALGVIRAVGEALAYAHSKGILHRDIKPSNILLTNDGGIFLADFGLARIAQSGESTLSSDMLLGTPHYISPEQAQGAKDLDIGTDIYSLGVVLYELSVGRVPFNADTPFSIIHDHIFTPLPLPHTINPKVPLEVERVLLKALAKDRKDRYPDVPALVRAFVAAVETVVGRKSDTQKLPLPGVTEQARAPMPVPPTTASQDSPIGKKPSFFKTLPWYGWIAFIAVMLIVMACLCYFSVAVLRSIGQNNPTITSNTPAIRIRDQSTEMAAPIESPTDEPTIPEDAKEAWMHLQAGIQYLQIGDKASAGPEMDKAVALMPAERSGVIRLAVEKLILYEDWVTAARLCLKGLDAKPNDPNLRSAAAQVFYHLAETPDGEEYIYQLMDLMPDWSISSATYARWLVLNQKDFELADGYLQTARTNGKGLEGLFIKLVAGEITYLQGDVSTGIQTLQSVLDDPNSLPWMRVEAERLIAKWQTP